MCTHVQTTTNHDCSATLRQHDNAASPARSGEFGTLRDSSHRVGAKLAASSLHALYPSVHAQRRTSLSLTANMYESRHACWIMWSKCSITYADTGDRSAQQFLVREDQTNWITLCLLPGLFVCAVNMHELVPCMHERCGGKKCTAVCELKLIS